MSSYSSVSFFACMSEVVCLSSSGLLKRRTVPSRILRHPSAVSLRLLPVIEEYSDPGNSYSHTNRACRLTSASATCCNSANAC